jgi:hypothetical protein
MFDVCLVYLTTLAVSRFMCHQTVARTATTCFATTECQPEFHSMDWAKVVNINLTLGRYLDLGSKLAPLE